MDGSSFSLLLEFLTHPIVVGAFSIVFAGVLLALIFGFILEKSHGDVGKTVGTVGFIISIIGTFCTLVAFLVWGIGV